METQLNGLWVPADSFSHKDRNRPPLIVFFLLSLQIIPWVSPCLKFPDPPTRVHFHLWLLASNVDHYILVFIFFERSATQTFWKVLLDLLIGKSKAFLKPPFFCIDWLFPGVAHNANGVYIFSTVFKNPFCKYPEMTWGPKVPERASSPMFSYLSPAKYQCHGQANRRWSLWFEAEMSPTGWYSEHFSPSE